MMSVVRASASGAAGRTYIRVAAPYQRRQNEPRREKTNILVSDLVRHKPGCTATEDGQRLEISDLESRGIILSK